MRPSDAGVMLHISQKRRLRPREVESHFLEHLPFGSDSRALTTVCRPTPRLIPFILSSPSLTTATLASWLLFEQIKQLLPQGLCTGCSRCQECPSLRHLHHPSQVSAQMSPPQRGPLYTQSCLALFFTVFIAYTTNPTLHFIFLLFFLF